jgi:hypothetical protein
LKAELIAEIADLPAKYNAKGLEKFEVIEVEEDKGKKSKLLVINSKFEIDDVDKIKECKDLKIFLAKV